MATNLTALYEQLGKQGQVESPIDQQARIEKLSQLRQQTQIGQQDIQLNQQKIQAEQQAQAEQTATTRAYKDAGGDINKPFDLMAKYGVSPATILGYKEKLAQYTTSQLSRDKAEREKEASQNSAIAAAARATSQLPDDDARALAWTNATKSLAEQGVVTPEWLQQHGTYNGKDQLDDIVRSHVTYEQLDAMSKEAASKAEADAKRNEPTNTQKDWNARYEIWRAANDKPKNAKSQQEFVDYEDQKALKLKKTGSAATNANDPDKLLSPAESASLGVPYGSTRGQAFGNQGLTSTTRSMVEVAPKVTFFTDKISKQLDEMESGLGPMASRWRDLKAGKIGIADPAFTKLRTDIGLLTTALMRMHVGARGGTAIMDHFRELIDESKQDPENLKAAIEEIADYAKEVSKEGKPKDNEPAPAASSSKEKPVYQNHKLIGYTEDGHTISRLP